MRPLDIVRTPKGAIAIITETNGIQASIDFLPNQTMTYEKSAWWHRTDGLEILGSIPAVIANAMAHPFGPNRLQGEKYFKGE